MSPKPRPTFNKLQKERARQQKQRDKIERKQQRKLEKSAGIPSASDDQDMTFGAQDSPDEPQATDTNDAL